MPSVFALSSELPLTKTITLTHGQLVKTPYPMVRDFTSHEIPYQGPEGLFLALQQIARMRWCLLKGNLSKPLLNESRASSTDPRGETNYVVLDWDGALAETPDDVLAEAGLAGISYVSQFSSSQGLAPGRLYAHTMMLLPKGMPAPMLKQWLMHLNLTHFRDQIKLNRIGTALVWPLDITTCQNDKLIYIAAPTFVGLDDPVPERIVLCKRDQDTIPMRRFEFDASVLDAQKNEVLHELRKKAGLPKLRDSQYKVLGATEYLSKPGKFEITSMKEDRGFRYFNLNGGDSWAYWQPVDDPRFVYNFKGEPAYLLEEIAPEFWREIQDAKRAEICATHEYFSFISPESDTIFNAILNKETMDLQLMPCSTERRAQLFLENHGLFLPETLPTYDLVYDPAGGYVIDRDGGQINTYRPPFFEVIDDAAPPEIILRVIRHAIGEGEIFEWFLKWMRAIVIEKRHTGVACVAHGTFGTGKGVLMNRIIAPLVGVHNAALIPMERLLEQYNGWMEDKLFIALDETDTEAMGTTAKRVEAKLKNWITEPYTEVRVMRQNPRTIKNHSNWLLLSNQPSPILINPGDRRYQVGRYQTDKIALTSDDLERIDRAVPVMYSWLAQQPASAEFEVRKIIETADRAKLIDLGKTTIDSVAEKLLDGDLDFFFAHLPTLRASTVDSRPNDFLSDEERAFVQYKQALYAITQRASNNPDLGYVTREELYCLLNHLAGNIRRAPHHFASLLKHHRIYLEPATPDGRKGYCMPVRWNVTAEWCHEMRKKYLSDVGPTRADIKEVVDEPKRVERTGGGAER